MQGLVAGWPLVAIGRQGPRELVGYIHPASTAAILSPPCSADQGSAAASSPRHVRQFPARHGQARHVLDFLLEDLDREPPSAMAARIGEVRRQPAGHAGAEPHALLADSVVPRIWIGNNVIVAAPAPLREHRLRRGGRRRCALFPPEQVANLYMGPFELTPAGTERSACGLRCAGPRALSAFFAALAAALVADLEPGDAIFIPYLWWHHVRSIERMNVLVNYCGRRRRRAAPSLGISSSWPCWRSSTCRRRTSRPGGPCSTTMSSKPKVATRTTCPRTPPGATDLRRDHQPRCPHHAGADARHRQK